MLHVHAKVKPHIYPPLKFIFTLLCHWEDPINEERNVEMANDRKGGKEGRKGRAASLFLCTECKCAKREGKESSKSMQVLQRRGGAWWERAEREGGGCERVSNREGYEHGNTRRTWCNLFTWPCITPLWMFNVKRWRLPERREIASVAFLYGGSCTYNHSETPKTTRLGFYFNKNNSAANFLKGLMHR